MVYSVPVDNTVGGMVNGTEMDTVIGGTTGTVTGTVAGTETGTQSDTVNGIRKCMISGRGTSTVREPGQ